MKFTVFTFIKRIFINKFFFKVGYLKSYISSINIDFKKNYLLAKII